MKFELAKVGDYLGLQKGISYTSSNLVDESTAGLLTINAFRVGGGYKIDSEKPYSGEILAKFELVDGDVLLAMTEQDYGLLASPLKVNIAKTNFTNLTFSLDVGRLYKIREGLEPSFLHEVLRIPAFRKRAAYGDTGSTVQRLPYEALYGLNVPLPPTSVQLAIVNLIESFDELIYQNQQISKTLEEIAQTIFKSWFIDFDPVKAKMAGEKPVGMDAATAALFPDSMEDSELGLTPKGWSGENLGHILDIFDSRRVPLSGAERKKRSGLFPYYGAAGVIDFIDDYLFTGPHVLVGEDGTVVTSQGKPVVQYVWGNFWVSNHAHVLKGNAGISVEYLKLLLDRIDISNFITGAVQPKLSQGNLKAVRCVMPSRTVLEGFDVIIQPVFESIRILKENSKTLVEIRDSLLPRLISGELQIPEEMLVS